MTLRLQRLAARNATICLGLFAIALALAVAGETHSQGWSGIVAQIVMPLTLAGWLLSDAQKRGRKLCYDYDSFVFLAWPVLLPFYLFQTRGWRAFITLLCFSGICALAIILGFALESLRN